MTFFNLLNRCDAFLLVLTLIAFFINGSAKADVSYLLKPNISFTNNQTAYRIKNESFDNKKYGNQFYSLNKNPFLNAQATKSNAKSLLAVNDDDQNLIVIQANYLPDFKYNQLSTTTSFNQKKIFSNTDNLPSLLQLLPGAQIKQAGGIGGVANVSLRGSNSNQNLLLLDDVRIESSSTGSAALAQLNPHVFEKVEMISGNLSALYGANAIGGVIHLLSKNNGEYLPKMKALINWGSYGRQSKIASIAGNFTNNNKTFFSINLAHIKENGFSAQNPRQPPLNSNPNPDNNGFDNVTLNGSLIHRFRPGWTIGSRYFYSKNYSSYDAFLNQGQGELHGELNINSIFLQGMINEQWHTKLLFAKFRDKLKDTIDERFQSLFDTHDYQFSWKNKFILSPNNNLMFGLERRHQNLKTTTIRFNPVRQTTSAYIGYSGEYETANCVHQMQANFRRDIYSHLNPVNSYYLGYGFKFYRYWRFTINYSTGYRVPTFNDLYGLNYGNEQLEIEHAKSFETAFEYQSPATGQLKVLFFRTYFQNLINYVFPKNINIDQADVDGIELIWQKKIARIQISTNATLQRPYNKKNNQLLPGRSRRFGSLVISYPYRKWEFKTEVFASSARAGSNFSPATSGYARVNFLTSFEIDKEWFVNVRLDNLFNISYQTVYGYNTPRRSLFFTLAWKQK